ncbi:MAG: F0F1 ATP synthase subunit B [Prevotellaceae bacterium]|jgi:F-type H+-transporting ATPase subunit b|nr:F0F1 ATP synthase subunit B [Prevotellaceae bacterium]
MSLLTPDIGLLFWMTLSFGIVFFILAKFGFPVITKAVDARNSYIEKSLEDARLAEEKLAALNLQADEILGKAHGERRVLLDEAQEIKKKMLSEAKDLAEAETRQRLKRAVVEVEEVKANAMNQLREQIADISVRVAEKVIGVQLSRDSEQEQLIERLLDEEIVRKT